MELSPIYSNSWALVIGINNYSNLSPLSYACDDADAISNILTAKFNFPLENVFVLKNEAANKKNIMKEFLSFVDRANGADDRLLVFYAGHGMTRSSNFGQVGYLAAFDADPDDLSSFVRWDDLTRNSELIPAKHVLFIIDACYSGLALNRVTPPGTQRFISDMLQRVARQVITAGKEDQVVADSGGPNGKNSLFTGHLIEGLSGKAYTETGILTASILMNYVYQKVSQDTNSQQTPHYGHFIGDGDFVFSTVENLAGESDIGTDQLVYQPPNPTLELSLIPVNETKSSFPSEIGYENPRSANFGRNEFTSHLVEDRGGKSMAYSKEKAFSWLALIAEPSSQIVKVDLNNESQRLKGFIQKSADPSQRYILPQTVITTLHSIVLCDVNYQIRDEWNYFLRLTRKGCIEFADSNYSFFEWENERIFKYVQLIGITWKFLFMVKDLLLHNQYEGGLDFHFILVGTRNTILDDFSKQPGEDNHHWLTFFDRGHLHTYNYGAMRCTDQNIMLDYKIVVKEITPVTSKEIITDIANNLGLAYNHQSSPRCFNFNTDIFPWNQYNSI